MLEGFLECFISLKQVEVLLQIDHSFKSLTQMNMHEGDS